MPESQIDPIVPISCQCTDVESLASELLDLKNKFGLRRFLLIGLGNGVRITGFPERKMYQEFGKFLLAVKEKVACSDIQVGWWCAPTLKSGFAEYQRIMHVDGRVSKISSCPLDEDFMEVFSQNVALVAKIAKPFIIQFEDDYELSNHNPVRFGCFCPLHLKAFAERVGRHYSREQLLEVFSEVTPLSTKLRRAFAELSCDSLVGLARLIRKRVDEVSPGTRMSLCQSGVAVFDGDFTEPVAAAFAGNTQPLIRVHGSTYSSDNPGGIPSAVFNVLYTKQTVPENFELIHESDTYPHTRFYMSASKLKSLMAAAFSYGMNDSLFYTTQYFDNPGEETGYSKMFVAERLRFSTIRNEMKNCEPIGCKICYSPWSHITVSHNPAIRPCPQDGVNAWVNVLGKLGIPYTGDFAKNEKNDGVKMVAGSYVNYLSDNEIKKLLSEAVFLDGKAAKIIADRGLSDLIGADVKVGGEVMFMSERIADDVHFENVNGRVMYNSIFAPAGLEGGGFYELKPCEQAKILTSFCDPLDQPVMPGMIKFENSLGGRVVITAFDLLTNVSASIFNYRKKEMVRQLIEWLGGDELPIYVKNWPNVFCICNRSKTKSFAIVTLINLCSDTSEKIELGLSEEWKGSRIEILDGDGKWQKLSAKVESGSVVLPIEFKLMTPIYLKFLQFVSD